MKRDTPHHRLYKLLKARIIGWEDLTAEEIVMMREHYPHLFKDEHL